MGKKLSSTHNTHLQYKRVCICCDGSLRDVNLLLQTAFVVDEVSNIIKEVRQRANVLWCLVTVSAVHTFPGGTLQDLGEDLFVPSFQSIEGTIGGNAYQHNKVNQWTSNVVEQCLNQLTKLGKPFKYIGKKVFHLKATPSEVPLCVCVRRWTFGSSKHICSTEDFFLPFSFLTRRSFIFSDLCDHAEKRCWAPHCKFLLLGQHHRRCVDIYLSLAHTLAGASNRGRACVTNWQLLRQWPPGGGWQCPSEIGGEGGAVSALQTF